ncbi:hypothetical protein [Pseudomonas chlororaphis]|uniref:hypothetical protein n=1 Tax=Pseudomonas chlororaphis TaxID=587753 RepID=UPI00046FCC37|nr:hypothetical protein [Pseudomonas chlororaphis]
MAKSNATAQKEKRLREKELLAKIGGTKRSLIVSKALADAMQVLGDRHDFEEWQETISTLLINLAAAPAEESARYATMSRPDLVVTEKWSRKLERFAETGVEI